MAQFYYVLIFFNQYWGYKSDKSSLHPQVDQGEEQEQKEDQDQEDKEEYSEEDEEEVDGAAPPGNIPDAKKPTVSFAPEPELKVQGEVSFVICFWSGRRR